MSTRLPRAVGLPGAERTQTRPVPTADTGVEVGLGPPWITILWNCDCHTFDQVAAQLVKAIGCSYDEGMTIAWQVHQGGKAVVRVGARVECERVGRVLAEIGLRVTVVEG